jgi:polysaccharide deacetylase family protein (PEP-CTERM system associated)
MNTTGKQPLAILTFDIEEWFNLLDIDASRSVSRWNSFESRIHENCDRILSLLAKTGTSATFFCLGWVARRYPDILRTIDAAGFEIASHTQNHQLAYELNPEQFRADVQESIDSLESITGKKVRAFRVPGFSITASNTWALDILTKCGISIDSSIFSGRKRPWRVLFFRPRRAMYHYHPFRFAQGISHQHGAFFRKTDHLLRRRLFQASSLDAYQTLHQAVQIRHDLFSPQRLRPRSAIA